MNKRIPFNETLSTLSIFFLVLVSGCSKDVLEPSSAQANKSSAYNASNVNLAVSSPTPDLDWENLAYMPTMPNTSLVPVPWQGGFAGSKIDRVVLNDYKASDGWKLVYNTFSSTSNINNNPINYFMLYNVYRGLLKTYAYINNNVGNYPSSNLVHYLKIQGTGQQSPILNFGAQEVINTDISSQYVSQLLPYKVAAASGSWFGAEFELAFDPNIASYNTQDFTLEWSIEPNSISAVTLNGSQTGDIKGTIQSSSGGPDFFGKMINQIFDAGLKVGSDSLANSISFLPSFVKSNVLSASSNALGGVVKGFLSGIIGGTSTSTSTQKVDLKINTKIAIDGQIVIGSQLWDNNFNVPGTAGVLNTSPNYPKYEKALGVFYISKKPVVKKAITSVLVNDPSFGKTYTVNQKYVIDESSFSLLFNDAVTSIANIQNIQKEVVMLDLDPTLYGILSIGGTQEGVAERIIFTGETTEFKRSLLPRPTETPVQIGVRISFDVVPKDGSPKSKIVKTFLATQIKQ